MRQIDDLIAEADEFHSFLVRLSEADWRRPTLFKGWTADDILQHLHAGDLLGLASATDLAAFDALVADMRAKRASGLTRVEETRQRLGDLMGRRLLERWRSTLADLCDALAARGPSARLKWVGPDMGVRMFATARQMEVWAHGQAIYDLCGVDRPAASSRLRNIAELGVRTFAWAYSNRKLPVPPQAPYIKLAAPEGETWEWGPPSMSEVISGTAVAFCQVVTQTRNVADTDLSVTGETARHWMSIAQCFAGAPEDPPPPGTRRKS